MSLGWPERGSKCRPVILSEAKDLVAHRTSRPSASLRVTEGHPLPAVSNSAGERKKGGYSFLCSGRIALQDSEDISLAIFTVGQPADLGNGHLRESNCSPMSCNFRGDIVNRR